MALALMATIKDSSIVEPSLRVHTSMDSEAGGGRSRNLARDDRGPTNGSAEGAADWSVVLRRGARVTARKPPTRPKKPASAPKAAPPSTCPHGRSLADCYACRPVRPVPKSELRKKAR